MIQKTYNGVPMPSILLGLSISLAPDTYTEGGGGLLDDVDVQFLALKFKTSDGTPYDKPGSKTVPLLQVDMLPEGTEEVHTQYFSCGDLAFWEPTKDGETLIDKGNKGGLSKSCNAAMFLNSLVQAGVPSAKLATDRVSDLVGIRAHVIRTKRPKDNIKRAEGQKEPGGVLTVSRLISTPWEVVSGAAPAASSKPPSVAVAQRVAATVQAPVVANGAFGDAELGMLAMEVLQEHGGTMKKLQLMQEVYKKAVAGAVPAGALDDQGKPARTTVSQRIYADVFLESQPYWKFDGATITLLQ